MLISLARIWMAITFSSFKEFLRMELSQMFLLSNIMESSLRQFDLPLTTILILSGLAAITSGHRYSHSLTCLIHSDFALSAVMLLVLMHSSLRRAMRAYSRMCLRKWKNCSCRQITTGFLDGDMRLIPAR